MEEKNNNKKSFVFRAPRREGHIKGSLSMKSKHVKKPLGDILMAGAALSALTAGTAAAQSDEIIVTAAKRAQTLQEVPIAVSVVDDEVIQQSQIIDLIDIQTVVPSLRVSQLQNSSQTTFVIRGFGNGANNPGIESSVGVFIDGVYRSRSAAAILDLPTLDRVEVLRGPQSTLFGKNVSAGAISITTKLPEYEWGGSVEATYGNLDQTIFRGSLTGPITDTLAFRVSGNTNNRDGFYTNIVDGTEQNERDRWAVRGQLLWEPSDVLSFRVIGDYNKIDEICCGAVQLLTGPETQVIGAPPPFGLGAAISDENDPFGRNVALDQPTTNELEGKGISLQADWDLGFAQLTSITAYREQTDFAFTDVDFTGADIAVQPQDREYETFTQEIRLASTGDNRFDWLVGAFFFDEDVFLQRDVVFGADIRPFADLLVAGLGAPGALGGLETNLGFAPGTFFGDGQGVFGTYNMDNQSYSFFGQFDYDITDRLTVTGGVSYIRDEKSAVGISNLTDVFSNLDLVAVGNQFLFQGAFAQAYADFGVDATDQAAIAAFEMMQPGTLAAVTAGAQAFADANDTNPEVNPVLPLAAVQFFNPQVNFPDPNNPLDDGEVNGDEVTWTARVAYDVTDFLNAYFTYSTGWKAGAFNLSSDSRPPDPTNGFGRVTDPEEVRLFELGFKASFPSGYVNIALFDQRIEGFQSNAFNGVGFDLVNAGEQSVRGFEVESLYNPWNPLTLTFGLTYLDPEYDSFTMAPCSNFDFVNCGAGEQFRDLSGTRPAGIHEISMSTSATYTHDFSDTMSGFARIEYLHESRVPLIETIPDRFGRDVRLVNASVGIQTEGGFEIIAWGRNITDNEYLLQGFPTVAQTGSVAGYTNTPRTYGVTVRKSF